MAAVRLAVEADAAAGVSGGSHLAEHPPRRRRVRPARPLPPRPGRPPPGQAERERSHSSRAARSPRTGPRCSSLEPLPRSPCGPPPQRPVASGTRSRSGSRNARPAGTAPESPCPARPLAAAGAPVDVLVREASQHPQSKRPAVTSQIAHVGGCSSCASRACPRCRGRGVRGLLGPRGLRLLRRLCRHCAGTGNASSGPGRLVDSSVVMSGISSICLAGAGGALCVAGTGATVVPLLGAVLARAASAACSAMNRITELQAAEHWVVDLAAYVQATAGTLARLRSLGGSEEELSRAAERVAELLERLDGLVKGYAERCTVGKAFEIVVFHQRREEIMGALGLWNTSVLQALQLLQQEALVQQQETLEAIVGEVRALSVAARAQAVVAGA
uniref:Uncharacterized protein n=1 Tax=Alexandrium monilatum TaxID=311494 RepID=A0A7S4UYU4_9DINO